MLRIQTLVVTDFQQNCRIVADERTGEFVVFDPGGEIDRIAAAVRATDGSLQAIVLTHSHIDHAAGVAGLIRECDPGVKVFGHRDGREMRAGLSAQAMMFGLDPSEYEDCPEPSDFLEGGDSLRIGSYSAQALFTPGHSPDHLGFFFDNTEWSIDGRTGESPVLVAGDALFQGSIGRTDLPGGNHQQLLDSIKSKLLTLPESTMVLPGHGPATTIGAEKRSNPFLT